jgi:phosphoribosyl-AMP cyclohydrolase
MKKSDLTFNSDGLIPAIIQDADNNEVLMMAYMNRESLEKTRSSGYTHFWSRSRKKMWKKGETSGHVQEVKTILYDCDRDTILIKVIQKGPGACHTGHRSCFFTDIQGHTISDEVFSAIDVYGTQDDS